MKGETKGFPFKEKFGYKKNDYGEAIWKKYKWQ